MTYKVDETQFWGGNLGYAKRIVEAKTAIRTNKMMTTMLLSTPEEVDAWTQLERNRINAEGAKIDKDVQEGLINGPMKFDDGKRDWSLLPYDSIEEIAKVLEFGKIKYAAWNWTEGGGFKYTRVFNATMRHLLAFMRGEDRDPDSGLSHIAHVGCNVLFLLHFILNKEKYNTCDDRRVP
jgi:hypothetical protein